MPITKKSQSEIEDWVKIIVDKAHEMGLDPYPTHFEVVPQHIIYELGSYGLPARFSHWTFGRDYHRQKTSYEHGMSKIYEIVFNTNPTQAFLVEDNSMLSHKFVIAHVLGHSDFFKRNSYFSHTDRNMIETVRAHADRIAKYENDFGWEKVEKFLDMILSIEEHFDTSSVIFRKKTSEEYEQDRKNSIKIPTSDYDDIWYPKGVDKPTLPNKKFPEEPEKDLLLFLATYGRDLEPWQRDIMYMVREEMYYFLPQMRTKIMNEGFACIWHENILESLDLTVDEHWEFRRLHSSVLSPGSKMSMNPYYVGFQMFKDIARRWDGLIDVDNKPETDWLEREIVRPKNQGLQKIFEVAEDECDVSFLRKYLTEEMVEKLDLYTYKKENVDGQAFWVVQDKDWRIVRDKLVDSMTNFGRPIVYIEDGDYEKKGTLYLKHDFDGKQLEQDETGRVMENLATLWGRGVILETKDKDGFVKKYAA